MKRMIVYAAMVALGMWLWLPGTAIAGEKRVGAADQAFAMEAASSGLAEVQLGKTGVDRASRPEVKRLAQRIVEDHTKANQELARIAEQKDIDVPDEAGDVHQDVAELFSKLEGAEFDREYLLHHVMDHEKGVAQYAAQANMGQDPELKAFAARHLPVLREHLQMARDLVAGQRAVGQEGTTPGGAPGAAPGERTGR